MEPTPKSRPSRDLWVLDAATQPDAAEQYRQAVAHLFEIDIRDGDARFYNRLEGYNLVGGVFGRCEGVAQRFRRTRAHIHADGADNIQLILDLKGAWNGDYGGRFVDRTMGPVRLVDMAQPFDVENTDFATLNLMFPRAALGEQGSRDLHGLVLAEGSVGVRLLTAHLTTLWDTVGETTLEEAAGAARAAVALIAGVLAGHAAPAAPERRPLERTLLALARVFVDEQLANPDLTPEEVRLHLGVSRTMLYRVFEPVGGVSSFIQARRLDRAFDAVLHDQAKRFSLAEMAYRHGFRSDAHFNRAFRSRFGIRPGQLRGLGGHARSAGLSAVDDPDDVFAWLQRL